jgi:hypothetical protein
MKVKIVSAKSKDAWYKDNLGDIYTVEKSMYGINYRIKYSAVGLCPPLFIRKEDCEIIQETSLPPEPFDLSRALNGEPFCTKVGQTFTDWAYFKKAEIISCVNVENGVEWFSKYSSNGMYQDGRNKEEYGSCDLDLFMVPKAPRIVTKWINVYQSDNGLFSVGNLFNSEAAAKTGNYANKETYMGVYPVAIELKS